MIRVVWKRGNVRGFRGGGGVKGGGRKRGIAAIRESRQKNTKNRGGNLQKGVGGVEK